MPFDGKILSGVSVLAAAAVVDGGKNRIEVALVTALPRAIQKGRLIAAPFVRESDLASKQ
jgi:hypothetical protein